MVQLQKNIAKLTKANIQVVAISYDSVGVLKKFAEEKSITYRMLSDPKGKAIRAYNVLNQKILSDFGFPAAHPGTFILDGHRIIRSKIFLKNYRKRHKIDALIEATRKLGNKPKKTK